MNYLLAVYSKLEWSLDSIGKQPVRKVSRDCMLIVSGEVTLWTSRVDNLFALLCIAERGVLLKCQPDAAMNNRFARFQQQQGFFLFLLMALASSCSCFCALLLPF